MNQTVRAMPTSLPGPFVPGQLVLVLNSNNDPVVMAAPDPSDPQLKPLYKWGKPKTLRYAICSIIHNVVIHPLQPVADLLGFVAKWLHALHDRTAPG